MEVGEGEGEELGRKELERGRSGKRREEGKEGWKYELQLHCKDTVVSVYSAIYLHFTATLLHER